MPTIINGNTGIDRIQPLAVKTEDYDSASITPEKLNGGQSGLAPIYGCRAWVNFDGVVNGVFAGGASTVTRTAGSPIATVTTTSNHNLITGNVVYALTGVVADSYYVTVTSPTSFTITTVATTALTAASITFQVATIRASGNVTSVAKVSATNFFVNLGIAMPDEFYSAVVSSNNMSTGAYILNMGVGTYNNTTAYTLTPQSFELSSGAGTYKIITAQVFR